jgi:8-oxo-dGTP pyrophosphatase MutT (NUDIX family)
MKHTDLEFSDWTPPRQVRAVALAVVRNGDRILMQESVDTASASTLYRPVGGTIEFLESGEKTVIREFREELAIELVDVLYLATIESIGESVRGPWHEIIMLYEASFADHANYDVASFNSLPGSGMRYTTRWLTLSEIESIPGFIHPHNLLSLLRSKAGQRPKS